MAKRILLITPEFYGYEYEIKSSLENSGHEVVWIENKNLHLDFKSRKAKFRKIRIFWFFLFLPRDRYLRKELGSLNDLRFDVLFAINCNVICPYLFKILKEKNPGLFSVLFLWDSLSNYSWEKELSWFDKVFTFDRDDSQRYNIEYKANFHLLKTDLHRNVDTELLFIGKFSSERFRIIESLVPQVHAGRITYHFLLWPAYRVFLHNPYLYILMKRFKINSEWVDIYLLNYEVIEKILKREYIKERRINRSDIEKKLNSSNVILDLPVSDQSGFTHRLIEALAKGKKVLTTNQNIKRETYYNPDQIHILDKENPKIEINWVKELREFKVDSYFEELELSKWLNSIINAEVAAI